MAKEIIIKDTHRGLWYADGVMQRVLGAGRYKVPRRRSLLFVRRPLVEIVLVDVRERDLTIKGQEILTKDKVAIRVSIIVQFKVTDPVLYEMEMMLLSRANMRKSTAGLLMNIPIESFIVHVRCLEEFFCNKNEKEARIKARHFFPSVAPAPRHPLIKRMHQEVAHLTYLRKEPGEFRGWHFDDKAAPIVRLSIAFLAHAKNDPLLIQFGKNRERTDQLLTELKTFLAAIPQPNPLAVQVGAKNEVGTSAVS